MAKSFFLFFFFCVCYLFNWCAIYRLWTISYANLIVFRNYENIVDWIDLLITFVFCIFHDRHNFLHQSLTAGSHKLLLLWFGNFKKRKRIEELLIIKTREMPSRFACNIKPNEVFLSSGKLKKKKKRFRFAVEIPILCGGLLRVHRMYRIAAIIYGFFVQFFRFHAD